MTAESLPEGRGWAREGVAFLTRWRDFITLTLETWREHAQLWREFATKLRQTD
jgi:hypothetical protein